MYEYGDMCSPLKYSVHTHTLHLRKVEFSQARQGTDGAWQILQIVVEQIQILQAP